VGGGKKKEKIHPLYLTKEEEKNTKKKKPGEAEKKEGEKEHLASAHRGRKKHRPPSQSGEGQAAREEKGKKKLNLPSFF